MANPNHDELGRFAEGPGGGVGGKSIKKPKNTALKAAKQVIAADSIVTSKDDVEALIAKRKAEYFAKNKPGSIRDAIAHTMRSPSNGSLPTQEQAKDDGIRMMAGIEAARGRKWGVNKLKELKFKRRSGTRNPYIPE